MSRSWGGGERPWGWGEMFLGVTFGFGLGAIAVIGKVLDLVPEQDRQSRCQQACYERSAEVLVLDASTCWCRGVGTSTRTYEVPTAAWEINGTR